MAEVTLEVHPTDIEHLTVKWESDQTGEVVEWVITLTIGSHDGLKVEARKRYGDHVSEGWCPASVGVLARELYQTLKGRAEEGLPLPRAQTRDWAEKLGDAVRQAEAYEIT